jgi:hypothetical protein
VGGSWRFHFTSNFAVEFIGIGARTWRGMLCVGQLLLPLLLVGCAGGARTAALSVPTVNIHPLNAGRAHPEYIATVFQITQASDRLGGVG